jgi:hypothetical protein
MNPDSSVDTVTGPWARRPRNTGSITGKNKRYFSSPECPDRLVSKAYRRLNQPERQTDLSFTSTDEVNNSRSLMSIPNREF